MWIDVWIIAASAVFHQPPAIFYRTEEDCKKARAVYVQIRDERTAKCINVTIREPK